MERIEWHKNENPNFPDIQTFAIRIKTIDGYDLERSEVWGLNGIMKGDHISYNGQDWTVVMVSRRFGEFGLSKTDKWPPAIFVKPNQIEKK